MGGRRSQLLGAFVAAGVTAICAMQAVALAATWWPSATIFSRAARVGLAANAEGGFLLVDGRGEGEAAFCAPAAGTFALGGREIPGWWPEMAGNGGRVIPGSPSFMPEGRSVAMYLESVLHSEYGSMLEGSAKAPAALAPVSVPSEPPFFTTVFTTRPAVQSATGVRGDISVVFVPNTGDHAEVAQRRAGSATWSYHQLDAAPATYTWPNALAVDGLGDTTVLAQTFHTPGPVEISPAYFAPPGGPFTRLTVPGNYFTSVASDAVGRSAIAGYTAAGPEGAGLYLSRRESPSGPFGVPELLSRTSHDTQAQLAYDAAGTLTVAWSDDGYVAVATATPGRPVGKAQVLVAPGATIASDEQLSVDAAGEGVIAWSAGAHEEAAGSERAPGLSGVPAPVWASVRGAASEPFRAPQQLASAALYSEGIYQREPTTEPRAIDAIGAGRAMVAWLENGPARPLVKTALFAAQPGCASPPAPPAAAQSQPPTHGSYSRPRVTRARHPRRHGRTLILGQVSCPSVCAVATEVLVGPARHRYAIARGSIKLRTRGERTLTASLTRRGLRLMRAKHRLKLYVRVRASGAGERPVTYNWSARL